MDEERDLSEMRKTWYTPLLPVAPRTSLSSLQYGTLLCFIVNVIVIFGLALAVRLGYWQDARAYAIGADEPDYVIPAQTLAREGRYVDTYISNNRIWTRVPLTSIFFAGSFLFVPDSAAAGRKATMQP